MYRADIQKQHVRRHTKRAAPRKAGSAVSDAASQRVQNCRTGRPNIRVSLQNVTFGHGSAGLSTPEISGAIKGFFDLSTCQSSRPTSQSNDDLGHNVMITDVAFACLHQNHVYRCSLCIGMIVQMLLPKQNNVYGCCFLYTDVAFLFIRVAVLMFCPIGT